MKPKFYRVQKLLNAGPFLALNLNVPLILNNIAHSDPAGQNRFGCKVKSYKGYYFTVMSGAEANGVNKEYKRRSEKAKFGWKKGIIYRGSSILPSSSASSSSILSNFLARCFLTTTKQMVRVKSIINGRNSSAISN